MSHTRHGSWCATTGPGLPLSEQEDIWERFHRAQGVEVQSGTSVGLGLGLYISRLIVERQQGQVGVKVRRAREPLSGLLSHCSPLKKKASSPDFAFISEISKGEEKGSSLS